VVNYFPFQVFDDALFYTSEGGEIEESLDVLDPSYYNKDDDVVDNIDEFIHVGKHKWDVIGHGADPIYDIEGHFELFPLQQPYLIFTDSDILQQGDDMTIYLFQPPKDDLLQHFHDNLWSYPVGFDAYSFEHLDLFYEENFQPPLCSNFDEGEHMVHLEQDTCDKVFQPTCFPLSHYVTKDLAGKCVPCPMWFAGKSFLLEYKGRLNFLRRRTKLPT
jgi:hypothetical protein